MYNNNIYILYLKSILYKEFLLYLYKKFNYLGYINLIIVIYLYI